jgi:asparagine synthase (glutamine-hydrolysing)
VGTFDGGGRVIGQSRLAVVDLITGDPPLTSEDGQIGVALNGGIYNFPGLRRDLEQSGHRFTGQGDTEVLAHLADSLEPVELAG